MFKKSVSVLLLLSLNALAQESLQSKMQRLQSVSKAERFQLMNEIKRELITLHGDQRKEALGKLRGNMMHGDGKGKHDGSGKGLHQGQGNGVGKHKNQQWKKHNNQQNQKNGGAGENKQQPQHGKQNH